MWVVVSESVRELSTQLYFFSCDINVHQHHLPLCDVSYIIIQHWVDLILRPPPPPTPNRLKKEEKTIL